MKILCSTKIWYRCLSVLAFLASTWVWGQNGKQQIRNGEQVLSGITPAHHIAQWKVISKQYATEKILKSKGDFFHMPQFKGIKFAPNDERYFYIAYHDGKDIQYITDLSSLIEILGSIDTPQEAILLAMNHGYFPDFEHNNFASNYELKNGEYHIELSKITSERCPFAKNNIALGVDVKTKTIREIRDISRYFIIYDKDCENHPQTLEIAKQVEEVRLKREEQAKKQKEINEKMERRIRKIQMKNNR